MYPIGTSVWYRNLCWRVVKILQTSNDRIVYELEPSLGFRGEGSNIFAYHEQVEVDLVHSHNIVVVRRPRLQDEV